MFGTKLEGSSKFQFWERITDLNDPKTTNPTEFFALQKKPQHSKKIIARKKEKEKIIFKTIHDNTLL